MYKIIGADQKEYGPITAEQARQWFREGRANAQTLVWSETSANWQPFSSFPEFADLFAPPVPPLGIPGVGLGINSEAARQDAMKRVQGPAIGLIATAAFGFFASFSVFWIKPIMKSFAVDNPDVAKMVEMMNMGALGIAQVLFAIALSVFIFYGGLKLKRLENHGLCVGAAWVALIPCISPCCCIGLPFGIWALVVMNKPEVKSQFQ
jgi:hypothetical protein